jgi:hypothetical protein
MDVKENVGGGEVFVDMSVEKFRMAAGADENGGVGFDLIDQQPVAAEMALALVFEVADELVVAAVCW